VAPRGDEGAGEGHGASAAVGRCGMAGSGLTAVLAGGARASSA
jgi:hypothetical protein